MQEHVHGLGRFSGDRVGRAVQFQPAHPPHQQPAHAYLQKLFRRPQTGRRARAGQELACAELSFQKLGQHQMMRQ